MPCILIIDDEEHVRTMFRRVFEGEGFVVFEAADGNEGIRAFRNNPIDLVIMDIIMPEKEGVETIRELKRDFPDVKIFAVSGGGRISPDSYLAIAKSLGAIAVFKKPVDIPTLMDAVKKTLI